jgi:hypothetical protein
MPEWIPEAQPCPEEWIVIRTIVRIIVIIATESIIIIPVLVIAGCDLYALPCVMLIDHGAAC